MFVTETSDDVARREELTDSERGVSETLGSQRERQRSGRLPSRSRVVRTGRLERSSVDARKSRKAEAAPDSLSTILGCRCRPDQKHLVDCSRRYSLSPVASRARALVEYSLRRLIFVFRTVQTHVVVISTAAPLPLPLPF